MLAIDRGEKSFVCWAEVTVVLVITAVWGVRAQWDLEGLVNGFGTKVGWAESYLSSAQSIAVVAELLCLQFRLL